jgi:hypothetical protein
MTDLTQVIKDWELAERAGDADSLERLLASDFTAIGPRGFQLDKEQWVDRFRSGSYCNDAFEFGDVATRRYGDTAVVLGVQTNRGSYQGQATGMTCRCTQVYVADDGQWKLAAMQMSEVTPLAPEARG